MDFESITYFLRACELKSLTRAAQEFYISQPTISRRVIALEDELGVELLKRTNTGIEMTEAGRAFYNEEKPLLEDQRRLQERMRKYGAGQSGNLKIGVNKMSPAAPVISSAKLMQKLYPDVDIEFHNLYGEDLYQQFMNGALNVIYGFRYELPETANTTISLILPNELTVIVPRGHRLWGKESVPVEELKGERFVIGKRVKNDGAEPVYAALEKKGISVRDFLICENSDERFYHVIFNGYLTFGGRYTGEKKLGLSEFLSEAAISDVNIDSADLCTVHDPSNGIAERYVNLTIDASKKLLK